MAWVSGIGAATALLNAAIHGSQGNADAAWGWGVAAMWATSCLLQTLRRERA